MHIDNSWRKGRNYKGKGKGKGHYKGSTGNCKYRSKGLYKGFDKGNKGSYNKGGYNNSKGKGYSGSPKAMDQARATKAKETTAKQKEKEATTTCHATDVASLAIGPRTAVPVWHIGEGEELHPLEQEQADQDNNEELPQDVNDTWDWYCKGEEGQHEVNHKEENWNDYGYDNSCDWNDNSCEDTANYIGGINESHLTIGHIRQAKSLPHKHKSKSPIGKKTTHTTSWNDHSKSFQQFLQEDTTQLHFDIAAATQQQRNKKIEDTITHYIMYSNFKSYHHLLIDSGASTHVCPEDYAPDLPLRPCGESVPQLYTVTKKKIPIYGIKYVPYKQDNFRIMMPYYVCDVKCAILSESRLLDRGYGLDFNPRHCTITNGSQEAHLIRHSGLFYLRAEKIDIPTGFDIYPMTTHNGKSVAVIQPTQRAKQQQEQIAPLTHTQTKDCDRLFTVYWKLDGGYAIRVHANHFSHHTTAAAQYQKKN